MAVKSAGDTDPYAVQRAIIKQKQINRRNTQILAAIRSASPAQTRGPTLPKYLKRSVSAAQTAQEVDAKLANPKKTINKMVSKYL